MGYYYASTPFLININYLGLEKDSLVICNDIKTIDTKRLVQHIYPQLNKEDIKGIQRLISKYISIF